MARLFLLSLILLWPNLLYAQSPDDVTAIEAVLVQQGEAAVIIALHRSEAAFKQDEGVDLAALARDVMTRRQRVQDAFERTGKRALLTVTATYSHIHAFAATLHHIDALDVLEQHPDVAAVSLDSGGGGGLAESVPLINANRWADQGVSGAGVRIAILDTGIDTDHPNFTSAIADQACFLNINDGSRCPNGTTEQQTGDAAEDDHGHGTHVAGIAAGQGQEGSPGVAPGAEIVFVKMLDSGNRFWSTSEIMRGLNYLIANASLGVQIISMSLGTDAQFGAACDSDRSWTQTGFNAVNTLNNLGVTVFAASMNKSSSTTMAFPACLSNVIAVGATDKQDRLASYSNRSADLDVVAPGTSILSSRRGGGLSTLSGTSMATPHAAGCAALLIAAGVAPTPADVRTLITSSDVRIDDPNQNRSYPRLDCFSSAIVAADTETLPEAPASLTLHAYPNPVADQLQLEMTSRTPHLTTLTVFDVLGRVVHREAMRGSGQRTLDTTPWATGLYLIELRTPSARQTQTVLRTQ